MRIQDGFQPTPYPILHPYSDDLVLPALLARLFPAKLRREVEADLIRFGEDVRGPIRAMAETCEPPTLTQYNQWGQRIDRLRISEGWKGLKAMTAKEGLVSLYYERKKYGELARVYGFMKSMLHQGDSRVIMCPMSMTDGCTRVLELLGSDEMKQYVLPRLISRDPRIAYTAGQWMTERAGGSDVSRTETVAESVYFPASYSPGSTYKLDGFKWFSSAIDGDVSLALARTGPASLGSKSLSLFLVPLHDPTTIFSDNVQGNALSNQIFTHRLKNKVGTHMVPTAELSLEGTVGYLVGPLNQGVKSITPVLNITRLHSCIHSIGSLSRCLQIARSYSTVRSIPSASSGSLSLLQDLPLHTSTLSKVSILYRALTHLTFGVIHLLGKSEAGVSKPDEEMRLRMLTSVAKGFVAQLAVGGMEECMVALGGQGYMEENDIGRMIRDCLVEKIWEGTPNVLAIDLGKSTKDPKAITAFVEWGTALISRVPKKLSSTLTSQLTLLRTLLQQLPSLYASPTTLQTRPLLFLLGHLASSLYLLEHALWSFETKYQSWEVDVDVFKRWVDEGGIGEVLREVEVLKKEGEAREARDKGIVYGGGGGKAKL